MPNTLQFCWRKMVYIHTTPLRSSPVSGIMHYPRKSASALETLDVALKTSPIPDQKKCRDPLQRSVIATSVGGGVRAYRTNLVMWQEVQGTWGRKLGHVCLFPKLNEMYLLKLFEEPSGAQPTLSNSCVTAQGSTQHPEKGDCAGCGKPRQS